MNPAKAQQPQPREVLRQEQALRVRSLLAVVDRHEDLLEEVNPLRLLPRFSTHRQAMSHRYFRKVGAQLYRQVSRVITFEKEILILKFKLFSGDSHRHGSSSVSDATSSSRASKEKPRRRGARRRRNNRRQRRASSSDAKSMSDSVLKDRFGMLKPLRLEVLMDLPSPIPAIQLEHAWNPADTSPNVNVKDEDPYTLHRQPVAQSTDGIRSKIGYEQGMHLFEVHWPLRQRGTHAVIGVCTADAPLTSVGYSCLIGSNEHSWGWDLSRNETHHGSSILSYPQDIQDEETFYVPDRFKGMCKRFKVFLLLKENLCFSLQLCWTWTMAMWDLWLATITLEKLSLDSVEGNCISQCRPFGVIVKFP